MSTTSTSLSSEYDPYNQAMWESFASVLRPIVRKYIATTSMTSWNGQEDDLVQDIVQESIVRLFLQTQKAGRGEVPPVISPHYFANRVARNLLHDITRKESRIIHLSDNTISPEDMPDQIVDPSEIALEEIEMEALFALIAQAVDTLPKKQRSALLIDLAALTDFTDEPSILQKSLEKFNIDLKQYQSKLPEDAVSRHRHAALLAMAYKKVKLALQSQLRE